MHSLQLLIEPSAGYFYEGFIDAYISNCLQLPVFETVEFYGLDCLGSFEALEYKNPRSKLKSNQPLMELSSFISLLPSRENIIELRNPLLDRLESEDDFSHGLSQMHFNELPIGRYLYSTMYRHRQSKLPKNIFFNYLQGWLDAFLSFYFYAKAITRFLPDSQYISSHDFYEKGWLSLCLSSFGLKVLHPNRWVYSTVNGHYPYTSHPFLSQHALSFRSTFFSTSNKTSNLSSLVLDRHKKIPSLDGKPADIGDFDDTHTLLRSNSSIPLVTDQNEISSICFDNTSPNTHYFIVYLHSFVDALHQYGYSGFCNLKHISASLLLGCLK